MPISGRIGGRGPAVTKSAVSMTSPFSLCERIRQVRVEKQADFARIFGLGFGGVFILGGLVFLEGSSPRFVRWCWSPAQDLGLTKRQTKAQVPLFSINTHLSTGLAAPISEHPGQGLNTFGLRLGQIVLFSRISLRLYNSNLCSACQAMSFSSPNRMACTA